MAPKPVFLTTDFSLSGEGPSPGANGAVQRFGGVAYGGGVVPQWGVAIVVDLATIRLEQPIPCLYNHNPHDVIGLITTATNDGQQILDAGELFVEFDQQAKGIVDRAKRGVPYQQSLGIYDYSTEEVSPGVPVEINGRHILGPVVILRHGHVREITVCSLGADSASSSVLFQASEKNTMPTLDELTQQVATLTAEANGFKQQVPDLTRRAEVAEGEVATLTAELATLAEKVLRLREEQVKTLFTALQKDYTKEAAAAYLALPDDAFDVIMADLTTTAKGVDPALFMNVAQGGVPAPQKEEALLSVDTIYAKRRVAAV